jgi:hypothetical protein
MTAGSFGVERGDSSPRRFSHFPIIINSNQHAGWKLMNAPSRPERQSPRRQATISKPYCSIGSGQLSSFLWKTGDQISGWRYGFNLFRLSVRGGRVGQVFKPSDLMHFVKLVQVLASVIADDGCLSAVERGVLKRLAADLDELLVRAKARTERQASVRDSKNSTSSPLTKEQDHGDAPHS